MISSARKPCRALGSQATPRTRASAARPGFGSTMFGLIHCPHSRWKRAEMVMRQHTTSDPDADADTLGQRRLWR